MKVDTLSFVLGLLSLNLATPRPTPSEHNEGIHGQTPFSIDELDELIWQDEAEGYDEGRDQAMIALLDRYAPVLKLSALESYFPSSIEYMFPHYPFALVNGTNTALDVDMLTPSTLDRFPRRGQDYFLSIAEPHNPQPFLDASASYLFGPAGQEGGMEMGEDGRGRVKENVYGFWVDQGRGVVDLWYWTFYPFNFGKFAGPFGVLGNHVGDWERFRMRTINGTPVSVDYNAHSGGPTVSGTVRWEDAEKMNGRPVAYVAAGSHGLWGVPGEHELAPVSFWHPFNIVTDFLPTVAPWPSLLRTILYPWVVAGLANVAATLSQLLDLIKVVDVTDDEGPIWDTKGSVVPFKYWNNPQNRTRLVHRGEESWLNFRGSFGNKGDHSCWWYKLVDSCQIVDAPPGPNRWFGFPPACLVAAATTDLSNYSFYLSQRTVGWAEAVGITYIQLEQMCKRPKRQNQRLVMKGLDVFHRDNDEGDDDVDVWAVTGTSKFHKLAKHEISTMSCNGVKAAVRSYRLSFCLADGKCVHTTGERRICAYEQGGSGYVSAKAVKLDDVDDWWDVGKYPDPPKGRPGRGRGK